MWMCFPVELMSSALTPIERNGGGGVVILHSFDEDTSTAHLSLTHAGVTQENSRNATIFVTKRRTNIASLEISLPSQVIIVFLAKI